MTSRTPDHLPPWALTISRKPVEDGTWEGETEVTSFQLSDPFLYINRSSAVEDENLEEKAAMAEEVKLLGWGSPYLHRVVWALKWKEIPYEFIQDDLRNKSPLLLQLNPVHKKIPILIHNGKPICESMIIVQYIDENWPENPLLPADPYAKAVALFWVKFADDAISGSVTILRSEGEEQEQAIEALAGKLRVAEEKCLGGKKFFGGDGVNIVDIAFGWIAYWLAIVESVCGVKVLDADQFPGLQEWAENFKEVSAVKGSLPDHDETVARVKTFREAILAASKG